MPARTKARKRALDILFASELRSEAPAAALDAAIADGEAPNNPYTETLVRGVVERLEAIDEVLTRYVRGWTLDRLPAVDRNVLRIGVWELLFSGEVPAAVAIDEATGLVRELSTDDSPSFVNGVLDAIRRGELSTD